jgi:hypothetical protein
MPTPARYQALRQRSFARHLDFFLTACFATGTLEQVTPALYRLFCPTLADWTLYIQSQQAKQLNERWADHYSVQQLDEAIKMWEQTMDLVPYRQVHDEVHCLPKDEFLALFAYPIDALVCPYCHLTQAEFTRLQVAGQLYTKRLRTRGTSFEADCREPYLGYKSRNVVACCYWCNNAKTDEFTAAEFAPVAAALAQVWRARLVALEE